MSTFDPHQPPGTGPEWLPNGRASDVPPVNGGGPNPLDTAVFDDVPPKEFADPLPPEDEPHPTSDIDSRKVTVTFFKDEFASSLRRVDMTLPHLAEHIRTQTAASKGDLPLLKLAIYGSKRSAKNCLRTNENTEQVEGVEGEHDEGEISFDTAIAVMREARVRSLLYTSPSYMPASRERWRIVVPLSQNYPPETREKLVARINGLFDGKLAPESFVLSQAFYYGSVDDNPNHRVEVIDGDFLDLRDDTYAGSIFKNGSKVGDRGVGIGSNGAGPEHKSRKDDDPEPVDPGRIAAALDVVDSNCPYEVWLKVAAALYHALGEEGFEVFDTWSAKATGTCDDGTARYTPDKSRERWRGARTMHSITIATLFHYANEADPTWRGRYDDEERQRIFARLVTGDGGAGGKPRTSPDAREGQQGAGQAPQQGPEPFQLFWHGRAYNRELRSWLVEEMIPETGLGLASGQWGTAKTFAVLDLAASVMTATAFAGREVSRRGGVLFIAAEGAYEIPIRLKGVVEEKLRPAALGGAAELASLPFAWIEDCPNLQDNGDFSRLLATTKQVAQDIRDQFDLPLALIVIDTLSAVGNFKDANDAAEGQRIMNRLGELGRQSGAFVLAVDHFGKMVETGTRGSSAKEAAADVVLALLADREIGGTVSNMRMALRKLRGGKVGTETPFALREVNLGFVSTCIVEWKTDRVPAQGPTAARERWPKSLRVFRAAVEISITNHGKPMRPYGGNDLFKDADVTVKAVALDTVRFEFVAAYPAQGDAKAKREAKQKAFTRALAQARERELIGSREISGIDYLWLVEAASKGGENA
jgi:hypothetical protein